MDQKPTSIAVFSTAVQQVINGPRKWRDIPDQNLRCDLGPIQQLHHATGPEGSRKGSGISVRAMRLTYAPFRNRGEIRRHI